MSSLDRKVGSLIVKPLPKHGNRVWNVSTAPALEPVTADELKTFARIDGSDEDTLIEGFIKTARKAAESYTGRAFITQTITMKMDYWPSAEIKLPMPPLIAITKVATLDEDDAETEYSSDNYFTITEAAPGRLVLKRSVTAPINTARDYGGYLIRYTAGYGAAAAAVPQGIKDAIKLWASDVYETRTIDPKNPPPLAKAGLDFYRVLGVLVR